MKNKIHFRSLMSLVAHRFGHVEFRIFVIVFFRQVKLKKSKQIFEIRHVQINKLLKYGFLRSYFFKNEPLISCPFLSSKLDFPVMKTLERHIE